VADNQDEKNISNFNSIK